MKVDSRGWGKVGGERGDVRAGAEEKDHTV